VGFGVQAAASEYGLGFVPVCRERYYFACRAEDLDTGPMRSLLAMLRDARFIAEVGTLPGYEAAGAGRILANFEPATAAT
jgi:molybdate-binding protein